MNKNLWMRVGCTLQLTDTEIDSLLIEMDPVRGAKIIRTAFEEGRFNIDGETYIPQEVVGDFNNEYGTNYEIVEPEYYL